MKKITESMREYAQSLTKWWCRTTVENVCSEKGAVDDAEQVMALLQQLVSEIAKMRERIEKLEATRTDAAGTNVASKEPAEFQATAREPAEPQAAAKKDAAGRYAERQQAMLRPIHDMAAFVSSNYEFRHNVVRDIYEYRRRSHPLPLSKGGGAGTEAAAITAREEPWQMVDHRQLNTINCSVQDNGEIFCLSSFVKQRVESGMAVDYHPIRAYLDSVRGRWDGVTDHVGALARRINADGYCERMVRKWLRAVVAQWLGCDSAHANAVMLLLVSERQGLHKSTFLRSLLPPEISDYYTDDFSLASKGNAHRKMVEYALVNIDEFDKMPHKKMPELKSLMQTLKPSFIGAYKKNFNQLPRIASFVGTSNSRQLLTDRTGSRRFLILEPDGLIPVDGIDHTQLYAQLIDEVERQHLPHYFTKDEEAEMEHQNRRYYVENPVERLFLSHFAVPEKPEEGQLVEGRELMRTLSRFSAKTMEGVTPNQFGRYMTRLGVPRGRSHSSDGFIVCRRE